MRTAHAAFILFWTLSSVSAQPVNVSIPGIGSERKHKWWVWLIVSVAGFSFLVSLFYVMRGVWVWRKRARGRIAAAKSMAANGYGDVESGKQPLSHAPKTSIFSFWNAESAAAPSHPAAPDNPFLKDWRKAAQISAANEAKLRQHGMGPVVLRKRECMYRMGEPAKPSHVLARLQRHNSL